ncbi:MAG: hypothetical protein JWM85_1210 [Acidimicrobiaceae bacterium]|nr:hypothetical protein [Acidimicrobiaceae bacterium]
MATKTRKARETSQDRPRQDWHELLDKMTLAYADEDTTIELLDQEFGDEYEAEHMPLAYIEYDEHSDMASVAVGGRDGRFPVALRHEIDHPTTIRTDSKPPELPLAIEIVGGDGSRTLVTIFTRTAASVTGAEPDPRPNSA